MKILLEYFCTAILSQHLCNAHAPCGSLRSDHLFPSVVSSFLFEKTLVVSISKTVDDVTDNLFLDFCHLLLCESGCLVVATVLSPPVVVC